MEAQLPPVYFGWLGRLEPVTAVDADTVTGSNEDTDVQQYINTFNQSIERGCYKNKERDRDQKRTGDLAVG